MLASLGRKRQILIRHVCRSSCTLQAPALSVKSPVAEACLAKNRRKPSFFETVFSSYGTFMPLGPTAPTKSLLLQREFEFN